MADVTIETKYVPEADLMALGADARVEVVDGEIVAMSPVGEFHHHIAGNFYDRLKPFVTEHKLGFVFMDGLIYVLKAESQGIRGARVPDVSFIRKESLPKNRDIHRPLRAAPTLAIEVISPDDSSEELNKKINDYFEAGTEQVWLAFPLTKEVHVYKRGESQIRIYRGEETMDVSDLFPGLTLALKEIFALPTLE